MHKTLFALCSIGLLTQVFATEPEWWSTRNVIDKSSDTVNNNGVANIGQAKWMVTQAYEELTQLPGDSVDFTLTDLFPAPPTAPDIAWYSMVYSPEKPSQYRPVESIGRPGV